MSRSILHDWECDIERISGSSANEMLDIAQDIYNTGYVRGKNYELSVLEDIKAEIDKLTIYHTTKQGSELISKNAVFRVFNLVLNGCRDIEDKHTSGK